MRAALELLACVGWYAVGRFGPIRRARRNTELVMLGYGGKVGAPETAAWVTMHPIAAVKTWRAMRKGTEPPGDVEVHLNMDFFEPREE